MPRGSRNSPRSATSSCAACRASTRGPSKNEWKSRARGWWGGRAPGKTPYWRSWQMTSNMDFDTQAAWLRRFSSDAESNLSAFALRLKEAMPDLVTVHETKGFFAKSAKIVGVTVELGENRYRLEL